MHDASGGYYNGATVSSGHPGNAYGWAVGGSFQINLPQFGAQGIANSQPNVDQLRVSASYTRGAVGYATNAPTPSVTFPQSSTFRSWGATSRCSTPIAA